MTPPPTMSGLLREIATARGLTAAEVLSADRHHKVAHARQAFMWAARQVKRDDGRHRYSLLKIAGFVGVDHTTVMFGVRQHERRQAEPTANGLPA